MARTSFQRRPWARHFEGWEVAVIVGGMILLGAALVVPRAAEPHELPVPRVDRREQAVRGEREKLLAKEAYRTPLPYAVRAVGERIRRFGRATAKRDHDQASREQAYLQDAVANAREQNGDEPLLILRAVQTELFLTALRRLESSRVGDEELRELAGDFVETARRHHWLEGPRLVLTTDERRVLYQIRWTRLTGLLDEYPFAPTLNEWRAYYRFHLEHPELGLLATEGSLERLLRDYVRGIAKRDPEYPALLAQGVLHYREGDYLAASRALRLHLDQGPDVPRRAWAKNHLLAAARHLQDNSTLR